VEIARLLVRDARLLILDEPTATLSKPEIERVFKATRDLVAQGRSVIFVSHRLDEVFELCDRVTVLRDGIRVGTHDIKEIDRRSLIEHMLGEMEGAKTQVEHEHAVAGSGVEVVKIDRLHVAGSVEELSLSLESGIITGLAGQVGSGTSTVLRALGGLVPNASGAIEVNGRQVALNTPRRAADAGVLYIPNDRQREGLFLGQAVERNLTVTRLRRLSRLGVLMGRRLHRSARELATLAAVPVDRLGSPAASLSGGNQQKVLLGRALQLEGTALLALDEPTRGVDVGGRAEIHNLVREAARKGTAVIFSSTELDEVLDLADVVVTIFAGRVVSVVPRAQASASAILADMTTTQT
jgi:ABC-type sugar transport system ATPase subunit